MHCAGRRMFMKSRKKLSSCPSREAAIRYPPSRPLALALVDVAMPLRTWVEEIHHDDNVYEDTKND